MASPATPPAEAAAGAADAARVAAAPPSSVVRPAVVYSVYFTAIGALSPYLGVYYRSVGLSVESIGVLAALQAAVALAAAPAWGAIADQLGAVRAPLVLASMWAAAGGLLLASARDPLAMAVAVILLAAGSSGVLPMLDSRTVDLLGAHRDRYGRARAWGSVAFIVSAVVVGAVVDRAGAIGLFYVYIPALALTSLAGWILLAGRNRGGRRVVRVSSAEILGLLRQRRLALFLAGSILVWTAVTALSTFFSIHLVALGAPAQTVGFAWALGAVVEVPLMFMFPTLVRRVGSERLLVLATAAFVARAAGIALTTNVPVMLAVTPLGGVGFALFYVGTVTYIAREAPPRLQATAQGIFSGTAFSVGTILGSMLGGQVAAAMTLRGLFAACAVVTAGAALVVAWAVIPGRRAPGAAAA